MEEKTSVFEEKEAARRPGSEKCMSDPFNIPKHRDLKAVDLYNLMRSGSTAEAILNAYRLGYAVGYQGAQKDRS